MSAKQTFTYLIICNIQHVKTAFIINIPPSLKFRAHRKERTLAMRHYKK